MLGTNESGLPGEDIASLAVWAVVGLVARGRHVEGQYRDRGLFEHGPDRLLSVAAQEIADAVVYVARWGGLQRPAL